jgi:hypothetical protein
MFLKYIAADWRTTGEFVLAASRFNRVTENCGDVLTAPKKVSAANMYRIGGTAAAGEHERTAGWTLLTHASVRVQCCFQGLRDLGRICHGEGRHIYGSAAAVNCKFGFVWVL